MTPDNRASDDFNDIATAIMHLQRALRRRMMEPAVIELSSWEDGQHLRHLLSEQDRSVVSLAMPNDTGIPSNQVEIAGTIIRWPARRKAVPGGWEFV